MPVTIQPTNLKYKNSNNEFQTVTAIKGDVGSPGISPTVTVTDITNGHRVTITDTNGAHNFDVMDGDDYTLTAADKAEIAQQAAEDVDVPVQDVQVNGISVLDAQGVANVPLATSSIFGVAKVGDGLGMSSSGALRTSAPTESVIKDGTNFYNPIVPARQHVSAFYGLAKAAGADMASSNNSIGTYTNDAKVAIRNMIGALGTSNISGNGLYASQDLETGNIYLGAEVEDVQVNGISVVSNGVANVPIANNTLGVVKIPSGTGLYINPSNGEMLISSAGAAAIKGGTDIYRPIAPARQHESTFYGLAKAAGADMASSNNSVGTYTDEAKSAIRSMLGVQNFNPQSIAIVANGDTHAAIRSGQYVYVQNHSTLTEGLYSASSAIAVNGALSASNLIAVGNGGLNALTSKYDTIHTAGITWIEDHTPTRCDLATFYRYGHVCQFIFWNVGWGEGDTITTDTLVAWLPAGCVPHEKVHFYGFNRQNQICRGWFSPDGGIRMSYFSGDLMYGYVTYLVP